VDVVDETQFQWVREQAELDYERFTPVFERSASDYPHKVRLLIETAAASRSIVSETRWFDDA
jgi:hypothetical protein